MIGKEENPKGVGISGNKISTGPSLLESGFGGRPIAVGHTLVRGANSNLGSKSVIMTDIRAARAGSPLSLQ